MQGLAGNDRIEGRGDDDRLWGDPGDDTLLGGAGDDRLVGGAGSDELFGEDGDDRLYLTGEGDLADGGDGRDRASYVGAAQGVEADLAAGTAPDRLVSIQDVDGSQFEDVLRGDDGANRLRGFGGTDRLDGAGGDDVLIGGEYGDRLEGGEGDDTLTGNGSPDQLFREDVFVFTAATDGALADLPDLGRDLIVDFAPGEDVLELRVAWADGELGGAELVALLDTNGDGVWSARDAPITRAPVEHDGETRDSLVVDLGAAVDPDGGFVAELTFWGLTRIDVAGLIAA